MRTRIAVAVAVLAVALPGVAIATTTGPPDHVLDLARGAAAEANGVARGLAETIASDEVPRGRGSDAFAERHALLAAKHAQHPGNAAAVHEALALEVSSPNAAGKGNAARPPGQAKKSDAAALRGARAKFAEGWPGRGLGRANGGEDSGED